MQMIISNYIIYWHFWWLRLRKES